MLLGASREIMGRRVSGRVSRTLTWITAVLMGLAALALVVALVAP